MTDLFSFSRIKLNDGTIENNYNRRKQICQDIYVMTIIVKQVQTKYV
jgi:hypothetical protein